ncbi:MAG: exodeoxyribonuclease VII large subunit [FCB group bacterium]|nr:exodeoxyribonuclease VII large subunit [FCB group bacterium]
MTDSQVYTVSEISERIRLTLETQWPQIRIRGECSNVTYHRSGHIYFVLKDSGAELRCVMFKGYTTGLHFRLDQGVEVIASGRISMFTQRGQLQCIVTALEPAGQGNLYLAFERLKQSLNAEGLFDSAKKIPLPAFPQRIGVLTSDTGAAIRDILQILARRAPYVTVIHRPTLVQGDQAAADIVRGLEAMERQAPDCIILGRGGGSIEDLWPFNEESVARAIARCPIPIVSAVGHETDTTIADLTADLRAPTPSAAAELVAPDIQDIVQQLRLIHTRLSQGIARKIQTAWQALDHWEERLMAQVPRKQVERKRSRLMEWGRRMQHAWDRQAGNSRLRLSRYRETLIALNPSRVLDRGYALALQSETDVVLHSIHQLAPGEAFRLRLSDGEFPAQRQSEE